MLNIMILMGKSSLILLSVYDRQSCLWFIFPVLLTTKFLKFVFMSLIAYLLVFSLKLIEQPSKFFLSSCPYYPVIQRCRVGRVLLDCERGGSYLGHCFWSPLSCSAGALSTVRDFLIVGLWRRAWIALTIATIGGVPSSVSSSSK